MASNTDRYPGGILPYGSNHSSIIYRSTLKSSSAITSPEVGSGTIAVVGTPIFDDILGMLCGTPPDYVTDTGRVKLEELTGYAALDNGGQLSVEVEADFFSSATPTEWCGDRAQTSVLVNLLSTATTNATNSPIYQQMFWNPSGNGKLATPKIGNGLTSSVSLSKPAINRFVTFTWSWHGGKNYYFFDGQLFYMENRYIAANLFDTIWLGAQRGKTASGHCDYYMRNIQISTRPVMLPKRPYIRLNMVGDSLTAQGSYAEDVSSVPLNYFTNYTAVNYSTVSYQGRNDSVIQAYFINRGSRLDLANFGVPGDDIDEITARRTSILANNPTHINLLVGTNNSGNTAIETWAGKVEDEIDAYLAAGVSHVQICTVPKLGANSSVAANQPNIDGKNALIKGFASKDNVKVVDLDAILPLGSYNYKGELDAGLDNLHLATNGQIIMGNAVASGIYPYV